MILLDRAIRYAERVIAGKEITTKEVIIQFLDWLETNRNVSIQTRNQRLACIKSFYKYVQSNELDLFDTCVLILSIKNKKVPNKMISYFSEEEIKIMINFLLSYVIIML